MRLRSRCSYMHTPNTARHACHRLCVPPCNPQPGCHVSCVPHVPAQNFGKALENYFIPGLIVLGVVCGGIAAKTYNEGATTFVKT